MRLTEREGEDLLREGDLIALGREADKIRKERFGNTTTFIIDRNINYTNVCVNECRFCAFFRRQGSKDAYLLSHEEILEKVRETVEAGGTQVMIQGGLYPELGLAYYEKMLRLIKEAYPFVHGDRDPALRARGGALHPRDAQAAAGGWSRQPAGRRRGDPR